MHLGDPAWEDQTDKTFRKKRYWLLSGWHGFRQTARHYSASRRLALCPLSPPMSHDRDQQLHRADPLQVGGEGSGAIRWLLCQLNKGEKALTSSNIRRWFKSAKWQSLNSYILNCWYRFMIHNDKFKDVPILSTVPNWADLETPNVLTWRTQCYVDRLITTT